MPIIIEPSILSADLTRLGEQVREADAAGAQALQIDVMDGRFVPNITFGQGTVAALRASTNMFLDVHLMIVEPEKYLAEFAAAGANRLIVHQEACPHLHRTLQTIRSLNVETGVALNPSTPLCMLEEVWDLLDVVQIMTVNPGFGGQAFIHSQLGKIETLQQIISGRGMNTRIAVDGGIDVTTAPLVVAAGATILVAGSSVFNKKAAVAACFKALQESARK
ncbi:MAG: ribulose-phosphate 3-epimerase [candidate division KSB1 bacterium]